MARPRLFVLRMLLTTAPLLLAKAAFAREPPAKPSEQLVQRIGGSVVELIQTAQRRRQFAPASSTTQLRAKLAALECALSKGRPST